MSSKKFGSRTGWIVAATGSMVLRSVCCLQSRLQISKFEVLNRLFLNIRFNFGMKLRDLFSCVYSNVLDMGGHLRELPLLYESSF